jgi:hypothetical protein
MRRVVYGDAAYGTGALLAELEQRGITAMTKVAAARAPAFVPGLRQLML